jgi:hypothetical protein
VLAGEAGAVWRAARLEQLERQLEHLGLQEDLKFGGLLQQIRESNRALDEMWEAQKSADYVRPWWQDGEYDDARADE